MGRNYKQLLSLEDLAERKKAMLNVWLHVLTVKRAEGLRKKSSLKLPLIKLNKKNCWLWANQKQHKYGWIFWRGRTIAVHRLSYEVFKGKIPANLEIDHLCMNKSCCNPDHLEAVTSSVNIKRGKTKKAHFHRLRTVGLRKKVPCL